MAVLSIGDQFPAYELTGVVPGKLAEIEANKPEDYFTTVSSEGLDEDTWRVVFFWPKDFTFVCPTEIAAFGKLADEFEARDCQVIGVSVDNEYTHYAWRRSHEELVDLPIVMASDLKRELTSALGVLNKDGVADRATSSSTRTTPSSRYPLPQIPSVATPTKYSASWMRSSPTNCAPATGRRVQKPSTPSRR